ncbi:MAG: hypothetical protein RLZZ237_180, partial [Pseudomonadota bacterium]
FQVDAAQLSRQLVQFGFAFWFQRGFVEIEECISSEADFFRGRSNWYWHNDWRWCWSRSWCCWRWWRSHALAVLQCFWFYAQWNVAAWHRISWCPVAGTPAQTEWITHDYAASILHIGAFWARCFQIGGHWRERWRGWGLSRSRAGDHCGCSEKQRYKFIHSSFLSGGNIRSTTLRYWCYVPRFYHVDHMRSFRIAKLAINFPVILPHAQGVHDRG